MEEGHQQALNTLRRTASSCTSFAHYLQKKETITGEEFMNMFTRDDGFAPNLPKTE